MHGRTKNLAEGGMAATVAGDIPMHEFIELQLQLPETPAPLVLQAEVRYRQGFQYGFKFIDPTVDQVQTIRNAVRDLPLEQS